MPRRWRGLNARRRRRSSGEHPCRVSPQARHRPKCPRRRCAADVRERRAEPNAVAPGPSPPRLLRRWCARRTSSSIATGWPCRSGAAATRASRSCRRAPRCACRPRVPPGSACSRGAARSSGDASSANTRAECIQDTRAKAIAMDSWRAVRATRTCCRRRSARAPALPDRIVVQGSRGRVPRAKVSTPEIRPQ